VAEFGGQEVKFGSGELIFKEGSPGGDLFFIRSGEVLVFKEKEGMEVELAVLKPGEILGIMTCLTTSPRLANAKAKSDVIATVVRQSNFNKLIDSIPKWVNTVIKDFILRIKTLNHHYSNAVRRVEQLERQTSSVELACRVVEGLATVGEIISFPDDKPRLVNIDAAMVHVGKIINKTSEELEDVFKAFVESGLLKADPKSKKRLADLAVLQRLASFAGYGRSYLLERNQSNSKRIVFGRSEAQGLLAIAEIARVKQLSMVDEVKLSIADIKANIRKLSQKDYDRSLLLKAQEAKLMKVDSESIRFVPHLLGIYLKSQKCIDLLEERDQADKAVEAAIQAQIITENF
jgi:CRP-like cAMP-binding protein